MNDKVTWKTGRGWKNEGRVIAIYEDSVLIKTIGGKTGTFNGQGTSYKISYSKIETVNGEPYSN